MALTFFMTIMEKNCEGENILFSSAQGFSEKPLNNFLKVSGIDIIDFTNGKITSSSARSKIRKIMQLAISYIAEKPLNAGLIFND